MSKMYESQTAATSYNTSRALPEHALSIVRKLLRETLPVDTVSSVLDLGGGTGRFSFLLRSVFDCPVYVIDPSLEMLRQGSVQDEEYLHWIGSKAEYIPLPDNCIDFIFMAQVYHHLEKPEQALHEISRVLKPSGFLILRNGIQEDDIIHERFFPEAIDVDKGRIPFRDNLVSHISNNGFTFVRDQTDHQMFSSSGREYYEKISKRGLSALLLISDEAFDKGLQRLKQWIDTQPPDTPVYESITHFIFTNGKAR